MSKVTIKQWLRNESQLEQDFGENIIFQVFTNQNTKISEIRMPPEFVNGSDKVKDVISKLKPKFLKLEPNLTTIRLSCGNIMEEEKLFFADHYLCLPCFIRVFI